MNSRMMAFYKSMYVKLSRDQVDLHSFPTRRSSDLGVFPKRSNCAAWRSQVSGEGTTILAPLTRDRSEEHTSELQSPDQHVCRLLLEKKKNDVREELPELHGHGAEAGGH